MKIASLDEMESFAQDIARRLVPKEHAVVLALYGDLGAGKTTFTQFLGRFFGVTQAIISPTFVLMKRYSLEEQPFKNLIHIDAYRIEDVKELSVLGVAELLNDPNNIVVIEWPENIEALIPSDAHRMVFEWINETTREVQYE